MNLSVRMKLAKETKGTFRWDEETSEAVKIGSLYVKKHAVEGEPPAFIRVEVKDDNSTSREEGI